MEPFLLFPFLSQCRRLWAIYTNVYENYVPMVWYSQSMKLKFWSPAACYHLLLFSRWWELTDRETTDCARQGNGQWKPLYKSSYLEPWSFFSLCLKSLSCSKDSLICVEKSYFEDLLCLHLLCATLATYHCSIESRHLWCLSLYNPSPYKPCFAKIRWGSLPN